LLRKNLKTRDLGLYQEVYSAVGYRGKVTVSPDGKEARCLAGQRAFSVSGLRVDASVDG
jgi:hypothetical protein